MFIDDFKISAGSIAGIEHIKPDQPGCSNNQDSYSIRYSSEKIIGIVCDGCGSGAHSEFGSLLGARMIAAELMKVEIDDGNINDVLNEVRLRVLSNIEILSNGMSVTPSERISVIADSLLYTVMGFIILPTNTYIFSVGDGVYSLNDATVILEPEEGNAPIYMSYALTGSTLTDDAPEKLLFAIREVIDTNLVNTLMIGSDGCVDVIQHCDDILPATGKPVGGLEQFTNRDMFSPDPVQKISNKIQRRLNLMNQSKVRFDRELDKLVKRHGVLHDDTTIISVRHFGE